MSTPAVTPSDAKYCARCLRMRPAGLFRSNAYCVDCRRAYSELRARALKAGTWAPKPRAERGPVLIHKGRPTAAGIAAGLREPEREPVVTPVLPPGRDEALRQAMADLVDRYGFTALCATCERLKAEIARVRRTALAQEGWIT